MTTRNCCTLVKVICISFILLENSYVWSQDMFISNLDNKCLECLCYAASNCNLKLGCSNGHCGPYQMSYSYWKDAGTPTLKGHNPNSVTAFQSCALTLPCARSTIIQYMARYGQDCNEDGVTDCDDYAMINFNGAFDCQKSLLKSFSGRQFWHKYSVCISS